MSAPIDRVSDALRRAGAEGRVGLVAFLTAGYPSRPLFGRLLHEVAARADVVELGVPFTDPMADGVTIQRASRAALAAGVTLPWILDTLDRLDPRPAAPLLLMSYLNPLLACGVERLAERAIGSGVCGLIVPDLPFEESAPVRAPLRPRGLGLVQLVTPVTPQERLARLCDASEGFVYAVTVTGITGGRSGETAPIAAYLARVRAASSLPVCAGFGIRDPHQVRQLGAHADGVIVGSALIETIERGEDPLAFLDRLRVRRTGTDTTPQEDSR